MRVIQAKYATGTYNKDYTLSKTSTMIGCIFSQEYMPEDKRLWKCVFCGHDSITVPTKDEGIEEQNRKMDHKYSVNLALWDKFEKDRTKAISAGSVLPPFPTNCFKNNIEIKRKPPKPTVKIYEQPRLLCTCLNSSCIHGTKVATRALPSVAFGSHMMWNTLCFLPLIPFVVVTNGKTTNALAQFAHVLATSCITLQQSQGSFMQVLKHHPVCPLNHLLQWK